MLCLDLASTDPFFNLAAEEYLLKYSEEEHLIIYIDDPSVIIGKHQVANRETDTEFVTRNNIPVIRRISGGGAVFHDSGNLNFAFIIKSSAGNQVNFRKYTLPVIEFLSSVGIDAKLEGKSDIKAEGKKISGNAEHVFRERVLHHGTLLFSTDLAKLKASLRSDTSHYRTHGVSSNPAPVINIKELLPSVSDINDFRASMFEFFLQKEGNTPLALTREDNENIEAIADTRYRTWEWNYAYGPGYIFENKTVIDGNPMAISLTVKDGLISNSLIEGSGKIIEAAHKLVACRHMPESIGEVLQQEEMQIQESDVFRFF